MKTATIEIHATLFEAKEVSDGFLLGTVDLLGCSMHAAFIRVRDREGVQECDSEDEDTQEAWDNLCDVYASRFQTIQIQEFPGDWVCVIHPHGA